jgi:hypothetical protein
VAKKPIHSPDTARKIWLAGVGAYGRAFSEAQESLAKLTGESHRVFEELVAKGEAIEKKVEERGRKVAAQMGPGAHALDERIRRMRERLLSGEDHGALAEEVRELSARVARLEALVEKSGAKPKKPRKAVKKKPA